MKIFTQLSFISCLLSFLLFNTAIAQNPSALYQDWLDAQTNKTEPILPTFSYAGYHYGERGLPSDNELPSTVFDVTKPPFNAVPNDNISDKEAIKSAIAAAESNGGGVVFFPPGRFIISDEADRNDVIYIRKSNIVIKGSGSGAGGTELYQKTYSMETQPGNDWTVPYIIQFRPSNRGVQKVANITADAVRETFAVEVDNVSQLSVGKWVQLELTDNSPDLIASELYPFTKNDLYQANSTKIVTEGVLVKELHQIKSIDGNTVTFVEPIHKTIESKYNWILNAYNTIEEVGMQDLKFTGGFVYEHLHHQAPQELYPGEPKSGPHAFISSSGWSGVQFGNVVNGWLKNIEFSQMSQAAQFKLSGYCTALDITYTGNPGHNFISTNSATGCFLGNVNDYTTGVWHGSGLNSQSVGNVIWRNNNPTNGSSGMEVHASQPRANLFDVCKGGFFFNMGGSTGALPNHLRDLVLWNFEGTSYQPTNVKSWRPNNETVYSKFLMPIISGLKGFTMSSAPNQYQVNESPGTFVDEESLYEAQLEYRLGYLPSWINGETSNPYYPIFFYEDFGAVNRGYSVQVVSNPDGQNSNDIGKRINDIPDALDSNGEFTETRPDSRIPANGMRDQKALSIVGSSSQTNYGMEAWVVMEPVDVSDNNPFISINDPYKYVSFWTEQRYANGGISALEVFVSTDYTDDVLTANWTNVTANVGQIATSDEQGQTYLESLLDLSAYDATSFTLAFKYTSSSSAYSPINRNGTFYISDVKYFVSDTTLSHAAVELENNSIKVYPNPFGSELNISNLKGRFTKMELMDIFGRTVLSRPITHASHYSFGNALTSQASGIYFLKLSGDHGAEVYKLMKK
ncbi:DUF4955 domain-containing protein [Gelidibacter maritimus]|uniref:DUF4955 domain-containing protein n=1 Tax=Gelidibacter maritimus TaxID=2761487 RepID=A0A7W2M7D3_9FLAO|nr:DUF4955 domain-containing protein [Gelidibacter maritimus]MBA6154028.1 DUF4955 domain-containing protein [Gelidibacter maritimus]